MDSAKGHASARKPQLMVDGSWLMVPTPRVATRPALTMTGSTTNVAKPWIETMNLKNVVGG
jgi:hypothetical protein